MIYHLLHVSTYPEKFLRFLVKNKSSFNLEEHHFIIETNKKQVFGNEILSHIHYSLTKKGWGIYLALRHVGKKDKIIVHYLGNPRHLLLFSLFPRLARRIVWSVWGGDAYFLQIINESWKYIIFEIMRKRVISHIPMITCVVKGDYEVILNSYNTQASYVYSVYPSDVNEEAFARLSATCPDECRNVVLVGNSADPSNNHKQILTALAAFADQVDEILVPLMYGGPKDYVSRVVAHGQRLFGKKFTPLTNFLPSNEYAKILCKAKVLVFNHYRQQGLGNAFVILAFKKKVYIRSDITSWNYFRRIGIKTHDTVKLLRGEENLFDFDTADGDTNSEIIRNEVSEGNLVKMWSQVFAMRF